MFVETTLCSVFLSDIKLVLTRGFDWFKLECFLDFFLGLKKREIFFATLLSRE
jgi:hypothetical protein